jgi:hypothetical protein
LVRGNAAAELELAPTRFADAPAGPKRSRALLGNSVACLAGRSCAMRWGNFTLSVDSATFAAEFVVPRVLCWRWRDATP